MNAIQQIGGVVVTYCPPPEVLRRLSAIRDQVGLLVIVDNGSDLSVQARLRNWCDERDAEFVANFSNAGLAAALNQGMGIIKEAGCRWAVTFDQDSTPQPGMTSALLASARSARNPEGVAVVGANTIDEGRPSDKESWLRPRRWGFELVGCRDRDLDGVTFVITSGSLTRVSVWSELGKFDEGLFIDYIDHDFCLKARKAGYDVVVSAKARLLHNLGSKREVDVIGRRMRPTFHSAGRHYYMARNRILMWRRYAWRYPHWFLFDACFGLLNTVRVFLAEDHRRTKVAAMFRGLSHGLLGRVGPMT